MGLAIALAGRMYEWMCDMEYLKHLRLEDEVELQNGNSVIVLELDDLPEEMINEWANSFRQYYCPDYKLDVLRHGTGLSRKEYLLTRVFPGQEGFGPGTKLGDFTELLISDYITYVRDFLVPKDRYVAKFNNDNSSQGTDVIGLKKKNDDDSFEDELLIIEVKARARGSSPESRLQEAVNDIQKNGDEKVAVSLNAIKHRAFDRNDLSMVALVERFQDYIERPFTKSYGAAAVQDTNLYDRTLIEATESEEYIKTLLFIKRKKLMDLVNTLYEKAADIDDE